MAFRVEGSVAKRKLCITPRNREDWYISGFHCTVVDLFSPKVTLDTGGIGSITASSDRVSALLDSLRFPPEKDGQSSAGAEHVAGLPTSASETEDGWTTPKGDKQPCSPQGIGRIGGVDGRSWQTEVLNDKKPRKQTSSSSRLSARPPDIRAVELAEFWVPMMRAIVLVRCCQSTSSSSTSARRTAINYRQWG